MLLLITSVVAGALLAVATTRGRLHPLVGGAVGLVGAAVSGWFLVGCAFGELDGANPGVQRVLAVGVVLCVGVAAAATLATVRGGGKGQAMLTELRSGTFKISWWWPWLLLAPTLAILAVFLYWPSFQTFALSTKLARRAFGGGQRTVDVCLSNFSELMVASTALVAGLPLACCAIVAGLALWRRRTTLGSPSHQLAVALTPLGPASILVALYLIFAPGRTGYRGVYVSTVIISVGIVALSMAIGLALAYLAVRRIRGSAVYRTLLIWPYAVSPPVAGILFFMMFDPTAGIIAHLLELVGIDMPNYRTSGPLAQATVILAATWKELGYNILFYIAALQMVPRDLIEAAALDGAGAVRRFFAIIVPTIAPVTFFLLVTNLTYAFFDVYGTVDFLTKGGPVGETTVAIYQIIRVGVETGDIGRGAAQSALLFIAVIALTVWQFKRSEGKITYGGAG